VCHKLLVWYIVLLFKEISIVYQRDGNGDKVNRVSGSASGLNWAKPLLNFVANNFLPVGNLIIYSSCYQKSPLKKRKKIPCKIFTCLRLSNVLVSSHLLISTLYMYV
jgi:hypothetical protein